MSTPGDAAEDPRLLPAGFELRRIRESLQQRLFDAAPVRLDRYEILERVGHGAMGVVYRARDTRLERIVAVKVTHVHESSQAGVRLQREARLLGRLNHPNVLTVHDVGVAGGQVYVAMEFVDGQTLASWCASHPADAPRRSARVIELGLQAARGLAAAHARGLIHRDVKPSNLIIGADGRLRVADFGLARESDMATLDEERAATPERADELRTATGAVLGTPAYMAPEQREGLADARSDQYGWAASLWEATFGVRPRAGEPLRLSPQQRARAPRAWRRLLERCLAPEPDERFADMAQLVHRIEQLRRRRSTLRLGLAVGLAVGLGSLVLGVVASAGLLTEHAVHCVAEPEALAGIWDTNRRATVRAALSQAIAEPEQVEAIVAKLDRYAETWLAERLDSCAATHQRKEQSLALLRARRRCLDRRLRVLDSTVAELETKPELGRSLQRVERLPALEACADPSHVFVRDDGSPWSATLASLPVGGAVCGAVDWQGVNSYDGGQGPSAWFVELHQRPVGELRWRADLSERHARAGSAAGKAICTGVMVSRDLFLTAGHCLDAGRDGPRDGDGEPLAPAARARELAVAFKDLRYADKTAAEVMIREVEALIEHRVGGIDYALLRVSGSPGLCWERARLARTLPEAGEPITIVQHPGGLDKVVDVGTLAGIRQTPRGRVLAYDDVDTDIGSSGAPIFDRGGAVIGIHVAGGCGEPAGFNAGVPIDEILAVSETLGALVWGPIPLIGDLDGGGDDLVLREQGARRWSAQRLDGTPIFAAGAEPVFGEAGDIPLLGDLDGDGKDELVLWRPTTGEWLARRRDGTDALPHAPRWGELDDVPLLGDLDGDGKDELVVMRRSTGMWYALRTDGVALFGPDEGLRWGEFGDVPLLGDLDGDGADELIMWRTTHFRWYALRADGTRVFPRKAEPVHGNLGHVPLAADVDGDGSDEMLTWRAADGVWSAARRDRTRVEFVGGSPRLGHGSDVPLVGDLDGEPGVELAIWHPDSASWSTRALEHEN